MEPQTLVLNPWMSPHRVCTWQESIILLVTGKIDVLEEYEAEIYSPNWTLQVPAVVRLRKPVATFKKGVKFSRINVLTRDRFTCQYCLAPDHKVLTHDLQWVALGDVVAGDTIVGFDENLVSRGGRRFCTSIVESVAPAKASLYRVLLEDGTSFRVTGDHLWLAKRGTKQRWVSTLKLMGWSVPRLFDPWETGNTRDIGWLAGIFDGEGWLCSRSLDVAVGQNPGAIADRVTNLLDEEGFEWGSSPVTAGNPCQRIRLEGKYSAKARFLGRVRPQRLLTQFRPELLGRLSSDCFVKVMAVVSIGQGDIVIPRTTSGTLVVDGFPHHNCGKKLPMKDLNYDHVIPRIQGGRTVWENIVTSCYPCNDKKAGRTPEQARMRLLKQPVRPATLPMTQPLLNLKDVPDLWRPYLEAARSAMEATG